MATFAELYYKKVLPTKADSKTIKEKYTSYPYELSDYFKKGKNLYDYEIKNETLKAFLDEEYESNNKNIGLNKLVVVGTRLEFIKEIKDIVNKTDYLDIEIRDIKISKERAIELAGAYFNQYEKILLNEDKLQKSDVDKDDINLINALYAAYLKQHTNEFYVSGSDLDIIGRDIFDVENIVNTDGNVFMEILKTRIKNGDPVTMSADFDGGQHGINAINLIQDIKNPNLYYVGVYDNNYPDEKRYVNILCNKKECFTQKNNYYSKDGSPIRITASLESDVKYFQN
jgi:hypothetical protein